jgi:hypothetical protein
MKKIVPIACVFLCLMFIIVATPRAQVPRIAIQLQQKIFPWLDTWGIVQLRFPIGSLTVSPTVAINDYELPNIVKYLYVGINASIRVLQRETAYAYLATGVGLQPFDNGIDSASLAVAVGVGWSPSPFLDIRAAVGSGLMLGRASMLPLNLSVAVQISSPLF